MLTHTHYVEYHKSNNFRFLLKWYQNFKDEKLHIEYYAINHRHFLLKLMVGRVINCSLTSSLTLLLAQDILIEMNEDAD